MLFWEMQRVGAPLVRQLRFDRSGISISFYTGMPSQSVNAKNDSKSCFKVLCYTLTFGGSRFKAMSTGVPLLSCLEVGNPDAL